MATRTHEPRSHLKELYGVLFLALGVFFSLCLISYDPADPALNVASNVKHISNLGGIIGAYTADILFTIFGVSAYVLCLVFFLISIMQFLGKSVEVNWKEAIAYFTLILSAATLVHLHLPIVHVAGQPIGGGGLLGGLIGKVLTHYLNRPGALLITITLFSVSFLIATHLSVISIFKFFILIIKAACRSIGQAVTIYSQRIKKNLSNITDSVRCTLAAWKERRLQEKMERKNEERKKGVSPKVKIHLPKASLVTSGNGDAEKGGEEYDHEEGDLEEDNGEEEVDEEIEDDEDTDEEADDGETEEYIMKRRSKKIEPKIFDRKDPRPRRRNGQLELAKISKDYQFPPLALLDSADQVIQKIDEFALKKNSQLLELKMKDYGVEGNVTEIHPGPVITMYEFQPAPGVKVNKVMGIEDDLSVSMGGKSIRIVPHIPGKAAVGIEIPNSERETVWLKEIIGDEKFAKSKSKLSLALGKNIEGTIVVGDLGKMPHLLVAGATGSGKSVAINSMICSILYKTTPAEVRMLMVDPKMLELSVYDGIPHLLLPVVTKPRLANTALQWAVREMERRYRLLSDAGVRNIANYNGKIDKGELRCVGEEDAKRLTLENPEIVTHSGKLPFIVIIIDELADLMMTCAKDVEESIARLAQMARAAGIHLILATQRPSVDVITGLIKANFPSRIAFKVSSRTDARTIMDSGGGAEKLLGMGDMLFMPPNAGAPIRIHGAFITEDEIARIVTHVKEQGKPVYDESILSTKANGAESGEEGDYDELYDQAIEVVAKTKQASISMIQRRFRIGYNRAARIIEKMESEGIVGPQIGSKPREILISRLDGD